MKTLITLLLFFLGTSYCYSQLLQGEWKGTFETVSKNSKYTIQPTQITLKFKSTGNNLYDVFSYTYDMDGNVISVCKVYCELFSKDSIYIEEAEQIESAYSPDCFQKMWIKIITEKNVTILNGAWHSVYNDCGNGYGKIYFRRKNN